MKAIRIKEMTGQNPAFNPKLYFAALAADEAYDVPPEITYPVGSITEGRSGLRCCLMPEPTAVPFDDECRAAVLERLESPSVKNRMEQIRKMAQPSVFEKLPISDQARVKSIVDKWDGSKLQKLILGEEVLDDPEQIMEQKKRIRKSKTDAPEV